MAANSSTKLELHALPLSPPSRAVHMALDVLGLDYDYVHVDVLGGGTRTPEFLSMNPQHTVPVLVDGNHVITGIHIFRTKILRKFQGPPRPSPNLPLTVSFKSFVICFQVPMFTSDQ
jgi:glutathione S-transferase